MCVCAFVFKKKEMNIQESLALQCSQHRNMVQKLEDSVEQMKKEMKEMEESVVTARSKRLQRIHSLGNRIDFVTGEMKRLERLIGLV